MCKTCTTFSARPSLQNDMDGGVAAALVEEEAEQRACPDLDAHWRLDEAQETIQRLTQERDEALRTVQEVADSHDETLRNIASGKYAAESRPLTPRENLAALWESAHRPVGGRIPAGTAIITRSDHGSGDVRYQTLEATGRDLPDPGYTLERNYNYGPENGEEYRLLDPPARPEGAEELARLIADADVEEWDCGDLADAILATGRVRVVTEEQQ